MKSMKMTLVLATMTLAAVSCGPRPETSKEEAELMGFTEYTALKYRSNLKKKAGSDPISTLFEAGKI